MRIGFFLICLIDSSRPEMGVSAIKLLKLAGYENVMPEMLTSRGQPAYSPVTPETVRQRLHLRGNRWTGFKRLTMWWCLPVPVAA